MRGDQARRKTSATINVREPAKNPEVSQLVVDSIGGFFDRDGVLESKGVRATRQVQVKLDAAP